MCPVDGAQLLEYHLEPLLHGHLGASGGHTDLPVGGAFTSPSQNLEVILGEINTALSLLPSETTKLQQYAVK
jgi:hypothetical protein